jgi:anti-sigma-K factor RskA
LDVKDYISSGILEAYVLGSLSSDEAGQVELMSTQHPEVKKELRAIEDGLFHYAQKLSKNPSASLKDTIFKGIENGGKREEKKVKETKPEKKEGKAQEGKVRKDKTRKDKKEETSEKVIPLHQRIHASSYLVAASLVFAAVCALVAFGFWEKWQNAEEKILSLQNKNSVTTEIFNKTRSFLEEKIKIDSAHLTSVESELQMLLDTNMESVFLKGMPMSPRSSAVVFWKKDSKEVYIEIKSLPAPPSDMQYQLWALDAKGKPADAGIFEVGDSAQFQKLKVVTEAHAFAVTLEKRGGSSTPDVDAMYVMGEI